MWHWSIFRCNGTNECPNGEDEQSCSIVKCLPSEWKCVSTDDCIQKAWRCDHSEDCIDGSDENPEMCKNLKSVLINYEIVIMRQWKLLMLYFSLDNHTEQFSHSLPILIPCDNGYLCGSGQCIDYDSLCDGFENCYDGSDENGLCSKFLKLIWLN